MLITGTVPTTTTTVFTVPANKQGRLGRLIVINNDPANSRTFSWWVNVGGSDTPFTVVDYALTQKKKFSEMIDIAFPPAATIRCVASDTNMLFMFEIALTNYVPEV